MAKVCLDYRTSSFCAETACVEVAVDAQGHIRVKGGTTASDGSRAYTPDEWRAFIQGILAGELHCGVLDPSSSVTAIQ